MLSDELFLKAEFNEKIGLKTSKKGPGAPVIEMTNNFLLENYQGVTLSFFVVKF
jgi:hypothetical protein